jgi:hypothetical protein
MFTVLGSAPPLAASDQFDQKTDSSVAESDTRVFSLKQSRIYHIV